MCLYLTLFAVKQDKHSLIKFLALTKLDCISDAMPKAIQDENILPAEFRKLLQEIEKYRKLKEKFRKQNNVKVR